MEAKYSSGTKVRIRKLEYYWQGYPDLRKYDDLTGEIVQTTSVIGYLVKTWSSDAPDVPEVLQTYRVHLDIGIVLDNVIEDCLEEM